MAKGRAVTKKPAARFGLIGCLVLSTTLFAAAVAVGQDPEAVSRYRDLVARYRGGENTTTALEALPLDGIRLVVHELVSEPDSCPGTMCLEAAALMHTDAALTLLSRGRVADTDSQLQTARWLLGFDWRFDDSSSDPQEVEESVEARQAFRASI